ncbi:kelch repeat-containing protein isoform X2 [Phyllopteryx taeniolatus]|uniref:kelch repeat-containing protein isoform X2 n=1 Tax=Phyllopteryx taeniolatus TaxID=161469 RepID=UPI002AD35093|nr:kelch repeat-containing protein isoform X2 [Phyllopteryx taeniolatus]
MQLSDWFKTCASVCWGAFDLGRRISKTSSALIGKPERCRPRRHAEQQIGCANDTNLWRDTAYAANTLINIQHSKMEEFGVYALFGVHASPQRLLGEQGPCRVSVAVPPTVRQVVLFSSGPWGERICVNADLCDAHRTPITIGKLTPYNRCLSWEQWEEETWTNGATLNVTLEGGPMAKDGRSEPALILAVKERSPKDAAAPLAAREPNRKRKRKPAAARELGDGKDARTAAGEEEVENVRPNGSPEQSAPVPKVPRHAKGGQKLFSGGGKAAKSQGEDLSWAAAETPAQGPTPEARIGHTAVYDPCSERIFVFGGSKNKKWFNDVHVLDTQSWKWTVVEARGKVPPLAYHSCNLFRGELFVLGGVFPRPDPQPDGCSDSLYIFDPRLSVWYRPVVVGDVPSPRSGHSACVMAEGKIYVFGGWDTPVCYNDMFVLDLGLMEFSAVQTSGRAPSPRCWHGSAVISATKFWIHGGYNGNNALSDAFVFDTDTNLWAEVKLPQLSLARAGHSVIAVETPTGRHAAEREADKTLLVFGGGDNEGAFYGDVTAVGVKELLALL